MELGLKQRALFSEFSQIETDRSRPMTMNCSWRLALVPVGMLGAAVSLGHGSFGSSGKHWRLMDFLPQLVSRTRE
jgi:hypothetical protein